MKHLHPVTFNFSTLKGYRLYPLVEVAKNPDLQIFDTKLEKDFFKKVASEVYIPLLNILESTETKSTIIVTGHFLELCSSEYPELMRRMVTMIKQGQLHIVANAYFGNSLTSLYHSHWWAQSIESTIDMVKHHLKTDVQAIYIDQLFRGLELERVTYLSTNFLTRHKNPKYNYFHLKLSELRKFNGHTVSWVSEENDCECTYFYIPNSLYFDVNEVYFTPNRKFSAKSMALKAGSVGSKLSVRRKSEWKPLQFQTNPRISEKYSLSLYTSLEKAVIRLWEYGAYAIASVYNNNPSKSIERLFRNFAKLQDAEYLRFLKKQTYKYPDLVLFTSPFEAFVHMQTMIKLLEMGLHKDD